jgi:hypothetical protein
MDADFWKIVTPILSGVVGMLVGRLTMEHKQDTRIALLENCLKGEGGIYARLTNIESAVSARKLDVPPSGFDRRH